MNKESKKYLMQTVAIIIIMIVTLVICYIIMSRFWKHPTTNESFVLILSLMLLTAYISRKGIITKKYRRYISLKKLPKEFEDMYDNLYVHYMNTLDKERKKVMLVRISICVAFIAIVSIACFCYVGFTIGAIRGILLIGALFLIVYRFPKTVNYHERYKNEIISKFIELVNKDLSYNKTDLSGDIEYEYKKAEFESEHGQNVASDDHIEGRLTENLFARMADIRVTIGEDKEKSIEVLFAGMFVYVAGFKHVPYEVRIQQNKLDVITWKKRVELDSEEFEKYFNVYCDERLFAARVLTSDVIQSLVNFYTKYKLKFDVILKDNRIYIRFATGELFEPAIYKKSMNKKDLFMYYSIMKFVIDVTKNVNKALEDIEL